MKARTGRVTVQLAAPAEKVLSDELIDLINQNIKPPSPLKMDDLHIRAMYIVSDQVNSFGGRFPTEELDKLIQLVIDSPVMVGHRKDKLPIGRNFHAEIVDRNNSRWLKTYFYWLKDSENGEQLQRNIDGGVYKECSIGFTFHIAECSICKNDIRTCEHEPFGRYKNDDQLETVCHFNYREIEKILETSFVYRGAVHDTKISNILNYDSSIVEKLQIPTIEQITDPDKFDTSSKVWITPCYHGVWVKAKKQSGKLQLSNNDGQSLRSIICSKLDDHNIADFEEAVGLVIGYRGKERCHPSQLKNYLAGQTSPVSRIELKLLPTAGLIRKFSKQNTKAGSISILRHEQVEPDSIDLAVERLRTRDGVLLWTDKNNAEQRVIGNLIAVNKTPVIGKYAIYQNSSCTVLNLELNDQTLVHLNFPGSQVNRLRPGLLYQVSLIKTKFSNPKMLSIIERGVVESFNETDNGMTFTFNGPLTKSYQIRRGLKNQKECFFLSIEPDKESDCE